MYVLILDDLGEIPSQWILGDDGGLILVCELYVPNTDHLYRRVMGEAHLFILSIHPGVTKMYHDMRRIFWWLDIQNYIGVYVSKCVTCQRVKAEYLRPPGLYLPYIPQ